MSVMTRKRAVTTFVILVLLLLVAPRPVMNARDKGTSTEPATLAETMFASASGLNKALQERPVETRTTSEYRRAIDEYGLVVRVGSDDRLSAESLARMADLMREVGDATGDY